MLAGRHIQHRENVRVIVSNVTAEDRFVTEGEPVTIVATFVAGIPSAKTLRPSG